MTKEYRDTPISAVYGEQLALTTTLAALGIPPKRDSIACKGVLLRCSSDFRYQIVPALKAWLKTADAEVTYTDDTVALTDRDVSTVETLDSLSTYANGDYLLVCADRPFGGIAVDVGNANGNASVMTVKYWNGSAWVSIAVTDGTANGGATLGQDGNLTWTVPAAWATSIINGIAGYWVRIEVSAGLDASVTIREVVLLAKDSNRGYGYANVPISLPLGSEDGGIEAVLAAATATLDVTWSFGNSLPGIAASGTAIADGADVALGTTTDAPFVGPEDATARTAIALLKGIKNSIYVSLLAILGATDGAAVVTDAAGTLQQYLRGLVKLVAAGITVFAQPAQGTLTDRSGTITVNNTSQQLAAANAARKYLYVRNTTSPASRMWINFTNDATQAQPSVPLESGEWYESGPGFVTTEKVTIIGAIGALFVGKEG